MTSIRIDTFCRTNTFERFLDIGIGIVWKKYLSISTDIFFDNYLSIDTDKRKTYPKVTF